MSLFQRDRISLLNDLMIREGHFNVIANFKIHMSINARHWSEIARALKRAPLTLNNSGNYGAYSSGRMQLKMRQLDTPAAAAAASSRLEHTGCVRKYGHTEITRVRQGREASSLDDSERLTSERAATFPFL